MQSLVVLVRRQLDSIRLQDLAENPAPPPPYDVVLPERDIAAGLRALAEIRRIARVFDGFAYSYASSASILPSVSVSGLKASAALTAESTARRSAAGISFGAVHGG